MTSAASRFVVLKFGGTSVATAARWKNILGQARARADEGLRPVIVCSAVTKMTDRLEKLVDDAAMGGEAFRENLAGIRARHAELAAELGVDLEATIGAELAEIERLAVGASMLREKSPRLMARMMAMGEILSTKLGAAFFQKEAFPTTWIDARSCFVAADDDVRPESMRLLSATVADDKDPGLQRRFDEVFSSARCVVTQGFIASDKSGGTVLLGRGGSDTSASYFAAKLQALRCEIWTDVPGIFTADPRVLPSAILVKQASYGEAQEIASMGAKVLHPRSIAPCRKARIPMEIRWTDRPDAERTTIQGGEKTGEGLVKALSHKRGVTIVSMETSGMWQQVGFLADVFTCFKARGLSVDLVSTSEMNVTATLDASANTLDQATLDGLLQDLQRFCKARIVQGCAAVSLVGRRIRAILHQLGPVLQVFEEQKIHLVTQAASDLNITFVVDEDQADRLVREMHALLFTSKKLPEDIFGSSWRALFEEEHAVPMTAHIAPWWRSRRDELITLAKQESPAYVYDEETIDEQLQALGALRSLSRVLYAIKANPHAAVLKKVAAAGFGFECVSPGEVAAVRAACPDVSAERILFTPNFVHKGEIQDAFALGCRVNIDNLWALEKWPEVYAGRRVFLRVDPGTGRGHHAYVHTGGASSKFGIPRADLQKVRALVDKHHITVDGLHAHVGSGILEADSWSEVGAALTEVREQFPSARVLDVGGGLGVPEKPGQGPLDLAALDASLLKLRAALSDVELWLEPGRFVVARAGVLLARVTQLKHKGGTTFVGIDAGMNALIRPALYGAYHEIVNLSRIDDKASQTATIVGPICESGDVFGYGRKLAPTREGDVILIGTAGAYGHSMASSYNLRAPPREVWLPRR